MPSFRFVSLFLRYAIALALLYSALVHVSNPYAFVVVMTKYNLTDDPILLSLASVLLPALHLTLLSSILFHGRRQLAYWGVVGLMAFYASMQFRAMHLGLDISCGCFSHSSKSKITLVSAMVPLGVALSALICLWLERERNPDLRSA
jgi:hypothetical protein